MRLSARMYMHDIQYFRLEKSCFAILPLSHPSHPSHPIFAGRFVDYIFGCWMASGDGGSGVDIWPFVMMMMMSGMFVVNETQQQIRSSAEEKIWENKNNKTKREEENEA